MTLRLDLYLAITKRDESVRVPVDPPRSISEGASLLPQPSFRVDDRLRLALSRHIDQISECAIPPNTKISVQGVESAKSSVDVVRCTEEGLAVLHFWRGARVKQRVLTGSGTAAESNGGFVVAESVVLNFNKNFEETSVAHRDSHREATGARATFVAWLS